MVRFRLFGIPVGVHATFLFVALLGATAYRGWDIAWWTLAAFVSILMHEMGHALSARAFGASGISVTLYGLGGLTSFGHGPGLSHGRSFVISAAGSAIGIVSGGAVFLLADAGVFDDASRAVVVLVNSFVFTSLVWGVLNWLPIIPLDGGHMVQHLISIFDEERAPLIGQIITWITLAVLAPIAWVNGYRFAVLILGFFALLGWREYRDEMDRRAARRRAEAAERGVVVPDEVRPAPPGPPTHPSPPGDRTSPSRGHATPERPEPPEFPI